METKDFLLQATFVSVNPNNLLYQPSKGNRLPIWNTYHHQHSAKHEHHDEVSAAAAKRALLQHATVAIREDHVEQKRKADRSEEQERGGQSPQLAFAEDQRRIEVQLVRRHDFQVLQ